MYLDVELAKWHHSNYSLIHCGEKAVDFTQLGAERGRPPSMFGHVLLCSYGSQDECH